MTASRKLAAAAAAATVAGCAAAAAATTVAPSPIRQAGFAPVDMKFFKLGHHLLHTALAGPKRLEKYELHLHEGNRTSVLAHARLGAEACGHPGIAHGGALAALLDDAMGCAFFSARLGSGFTAALNMSYKKPVPAGRDLLVHAEIDRIEPSSSGRSTKVWLRGSITDADGTVYTTAESLFIVKAGLPGIGNLVTATLAAVAGVPPAAAVQAGSVAPGARAQPL